MVRIKPSCVADGAGVVPVWMHHLFRYQKKAHYMGLSAEKHSYLFTRGGAHSWLAKRTALRAEAWRHDSSQRGIVVPKVESVVRKRHVHTRGGWDNFVYVRIDVISVPADIRAGGGQHDRVY